MRERWRDIPDYEDYYRVSDKGRVYSVPRTIYRSNGYPQSVRGRILKAAISAYGHSLVVLRRGGKGQTSFVHRLVLEAFIGPCPDGLEACHKDGRHLNNRLSNLRWDTHASNMADTVKHDIRGHRVRRSDGVEYRTCQEASRAVDVADSSVARSIRLDQRCAGYTWELIHG